MNNPRTTVPGFILLLGSICYLIGHALMAAFGAPDASHVLPAVIQTVMTDWPGVIVALGGLGLVGAKDGGR